MDQDPVNVRDRLSDVPLDPLVCQVRPREVFDLKATFTSIASSIFLNVAGSMEASRQIEPFFSDCITSFLAMKVHNVIQVLREGET